MKNVLARLFKILTIAVLLLLFPLVMAYQLFETMIVWTLYYVITGKRYLNLYYPLIVVYYDFLEYLIGVSTIDDVTFKRKYYYD